MNKRIFSKIVIFLLILLLINNSSYAVNVTKDDLKNSLEKMFNSDIEIKKIRKVESDFNDEVTDIIEYKVPENVLITESQIILTDINETSNLKEVIKVDYTLNENKCIFEISSNPSDYGIEDVSSNPGIISKILFDQTDVMNIGLLTIADAMGVDLETVNSYSTQITNELNYEELSNETDLFKYSIKYDEEFNINKYLEIDLVRLAEIKESDLDGTVKSVITVIQPDKEENNTDNVVENETSSFEDESNDYSETKINTEPEKLKKDYGMNYYVSIGMIVVGIFILIVLIYIKMKKRI